MLFQKKFVFSVLLILGIILNSNVHSYSNSKNFSHQIYCSQEYKPALKKLEQIGEIRNLIQRVLAEGPIRITSGGTAADDYQGYWNGTDRVIVLNPALSRTLGEHISTILMELNNASTNHELMRISDMAAAGKLTKDQYVEQIERMEHKNGLNTCRLLQKGHDLGIFPRDYCWDVYKSFDDYYMLQQILGHSALIANNYNYLSPQGRRQSYRGTVPNLHRLSKRDQESIGLYLQLKNDMQDSDRVVRERAQKRFSEELHYIRSGANRFQNASDASKKASYIEHIFKIQV